jgi:hypothetical protein
VSQLLPHSYNRLMYTCAGAYAVCVYLSFTTGIKVK